MKFFRIKRYVKEALDSLPNGICFFNDQGVLVLANRIMYQLVEGLVQNDLQTMQDLDSLFPTNSNQTTQQLPYGRYWKFIKQKIIDDEQFEYTQYLAFDVSDLLRQKIKLEESYQQQEALALQMKHIMENITTITREEEILQMKMRIHNDVGWFLQSLRQYYIANLPSDKKSKIVTDLQQLVRHLQGEIDQEDQNNLFEDLIRSANTLGVQVHLDGQLPKEESLHQLILAVIRECITNTLMHARGNEVYGRITQSSSSIKAIFSNNGQPPDTIIVEGGGFSSLRHKVQLKGGTMRIDSLPRFVLTIDLPYRKGEVNEN